MSELHTHQDGDRLSLRIEGSLTIADVTSLRLAMLAALTAPPQPVKEVVLDLHAVGEADGAGVQLLASAAQWLRDLHVRPVLGNSAPGVDQVAHALGAADEGQCCGFERVGDQGEPS